ncbi:hypothetical protein GCM10007049_08170 [Echinicola pacifica]|uniref:Thiamine pyrophosphokinase n=1 Tax=Echinicola pacifica TaxID=346377 RepID=A0A918PPQ1_9BACT|nr:hypothetical protein [Echinicola pacifica]GGZ18384.1 hypothetical protein GCM10007049_08170 [Echinicola pacifica]
MSSHHFVKEQQEPALLILDASSYAYEDIAPLLEWVPTVLVAQHQVDKVLSWGIKIDVILADEAFQKVNYSLLEEQYPLRFLTVKEQKFLEEGLQYLIATKHGAANLVGYDHQHANLLLPHLEYINLVIFDGPMRYFPVRDKSFQKWFAQSAVQIHGAEGQPVEIQSAEQTQIVNIKYATFVELDEGSHSIRAMHPIWIGEMIK